VRHGSPYSEALRSLGADFRAQRLLAAEARSARLPALLTLPLILFIMPAVFIVVVGPAVISMGALFDR
jgi:tight adherence protein C